MLNLPLLFVLMQIQIYMAQNASFIVHCSLILISTILYLDQERLIVSNNKVLVDWLFYTEKENIKKKRKQ